MLQSSLHIGRSPAAGFTLLELMITLAVAAVLAAIAIPNLQTFSKNNRLAGAANDLLRSFQVARTEAVKRQRNVVVCGTSDPTADAPACTYDTFTGWISFQDTNNNWQADAGEPILERHNVLDNTVTVRTDEDAAASYAPTGFANPAGSKTPSNYILLCDDRGNQALGNNSTARVVIIENTGRTRASHAVADVNTAETAIGQCHT